MNAVAGVRSPVAGIDQLQVDKNLPRIHERRISHFLRAVRTAVRTAARAIGAAIPIFRSSIWNSR
jgi:hypothetical protein